MTWPLQQCHLLSKTSLFTVKWILHYTEKKPYAKGLHTFKASNPNNWFCLSYRSQCSSLAFQTYVTHENMLRFKASTYCMQLSQIQPVHFWSLLILATNESLKYRRKKMCLRQFWDFLSPWNVVFEHFKISISQYLKQM